MSGLVLSIFPGLGLLDRAFESEGFTTVRGPDPIWGGDVRTWRPPAGVFDGVIGGDPCQSPSTLANLVRAKGLTPSFPDMTDEFLRVVDEARPRWFLRENVPRAPGIVHEDYAIHSFLVDNAWLDRGDGIGEEQMRRRRFWFGLRGGPYVDLRRHLRFAALELPDAALAGHDGQILPNPHRGKRQACVAGKGHGPGVRDAMVKRQAVCGDARAVSVKLGGSGKVKASAVTSRHAGEIGKTGGHRGTPGKYSVAEMLELQGLPADFLDHCPFTDQGKRKAIGNGVAQATGRALARAIRAALAALEVAA